MPLLVISSPNGGVGKTTLAANFAAQLARSGESVTLVELSTQNILRRYFGLTDIGPAIASPSQSDAAGAAPVLAAAAFRVEDNLKVIPHALIAGDAETSTPAEGLSFLGKLSRHAAFQDDIVLVD
ncbi:MAG: cellulose synthase operon protein YhjQ/BcsQ, partial [Pseudomonadota bacterium]